jgi:hypothetical protein
MHVMPGSNRSVVAEAKDLNPRRVRAFRYSYRLLPGLPSFTLAQKTEEGRIPRPSPFGFVTGALTNQVSAGSRTGTSRS